MPAVRYLLDTNIVSVVVKEPGSALAQRLAAMPRSEFGISIVVACELRYGAARKGSARSNYGEIRSELEHIGRPFGYNDLLIVAHARFLGAMLVTYNTNKFSSVPGLVVEDWLVDGPG